MPVIRTAHFRTWLLANPETFLWNNVVVYDPPALADAEALAAYQARVLPRINLLPTKSNVAGVVVNYVVQNPKSPLARLLAKKSDDAYWRPTNGSLYEVTYDPQNGLANNATRDDHGYLLPWISRDLAKIRARPDAGLFFNALMTGCSFGWRFESDSSLVELHSNYTDRDKTEQEKKTTGTERWSEQEIARLMSQDTENITIISPSAYRSTERTENSSIIGVHNGKRWLLYEQVHRKDLGNGAGDETTYLYRIYSVRRIA